MKNSTIPDLSTNQIAELDIKHLNEYLQEIEAFENDPKNDKLMSRYTNVTVRKANQFMSDIAKKHNIETTSSGGFLFDENSITPVLNDLLIYIAKMYRHALIVTHSQVKNMTSDFIVKPPKS